VHQNTEGCKKKLVMLFLYVVWAECDEIWHDERHSCVADIVQLWSTFAGAQIFDSGYLPHFLS